MLPRNKMLPRPIPMGKSRTNRPILETRSTKIIPFESSLYPIQAQEHTFTAVDLVIYLLVNTLVLEKHSSSNSYRRQEPISDPLEK